jgi:hypothetical protein
MWPGQDIVSTRSGIQVATPRVQKRADMAAAYECLLQAVPRTCTLQIQMS